jgi:hypothetical protein
MFPYSTMIGPIIWMAMGALAVIFLYGASLWLKDLGIAMKWWKWLLFAGWFAGICLVIAGAFTLIGENETRAGLYFLGVFGTIMIILGVGLWRLLKT